MLAAIIGTIHETPAFADIACTACMMPCSPDTSAFGIASSTANVPAMYSTVMTTPAARTARGTVRRAS